jgi:plasmid stabilization system protein ParE
LRRAATKRALNTLLEILEYYEEYTCERVAKEMIQGILNEPERLEKDPFIGQKEGLLKDRKISYRYRVFKHYKIIYSVDEENGFIKITDVLGTRQRPNKIERFE